MLIKSIIAMAAAILLVVSAAFIFRKYSKGKLDADPDGSTAGHSGALLSALFLLVFAIGVIVPWTDNDAAQQNTYTETQALTEAYWSTGSLPKPEATQIRAGLKDYTAFVEKKEWPIMASGHLSQEGWKKLDTVRSELASMQFVSETDRDVQSDVLGQLRTVYQARHERAADAESSLPPAVLLFIVVTGLVMVIFPFLSGARPHGMALVPLIVMAGMIGVSIALIFNINQTFSGGLGVEPTAFTNALREYLRIR